MYTQQAKFLNLSVDEYLRYEVESVIRHEYIAGQVYPITKGNDNSKIITENILTRLRTHLHGSDYRVFSDMKVKIEPLNIFYYPEILVTSNPFDRQKFFKSRPCLIVEVISPDTERINRNEKLRNYQYLESLQEYVLVSQADLEVNVYRKHHQGNWISEKLTQTDVMTFASVGLEMTMAEIYEDVEFCQRF